MAPSEWIIQNRTSCLKFSSFLAPISWKKLQQPYFWSSCSLACESTLWVAVPPLSEPGPCLPPLVPKACKQLDRLFHKGDFGTMRCVLGW